MACLKCACRFGQLSCHGQSDMSSVNISNPSGATDWVGELPQTPSAQRSAGQARSSQSCRASLDAYSMRGASGLVRGVAAERGTDVEGAERAWRQVSQSLFLYFVYVMHAFFLPPCSPTSKFLQLPLWGSIISRAAVERSCKRS